jgi:hypothetical protein
VLVAQKEKLEALFGKVSRWHKSHFYKQVLPKFAVW